MPALLQQVSEEQSGGAGAEDADLGADGGSHENLFVRAVRPCRSSLFRAIARAEQCETSMRWKF